MLLVFKVITIQRLDEFSHYMWSAPFLKLNNTMEVYAESLFTNGVSVVIGLKHVLLGEPSLI